MAIELISKIKPKGTFPMVDAEDVLMPDGSRLSEFEIGQPGGSGEPGKDGKDGVSCTHSWNGTVLTVTSASGTTSADLKGAKGDTGATGAKGDKGDTGAQGIQGAKGDKGDKGDAGAAGANGKDGTNGKDGYTPVKGVDYYTATDKAEFQTYLRTLFGENIVSLTQAEYDALVSAGTVDPNKYYMIVGDGE